MLDYRHGPTSFRSPHWTLSGVSDWLPRSRGHLTKKSNNPDSFSRFRFNGTPSMAGRMGNPRRIIGAANRKKEKETGQSPASVPRSSRRRRRSSSRPRLRWPRAANATSCGRKNAPFPQKKKLQHLLPQKNVTAMPQENPYSHCKSVARGSTILILERWTRENRGKKNPVKWTQ